ncbi:lipase member H-like isoform X2 [Brevipalpus obovatus]
MGADKLVKAEVCYPTYGCFSNERYFDFESRPLNEVPASPKVINLTYELFTSKNPKDSIVIKYDDPDLQTTVSKINFDPNRPSKFLIHGWRTKPLHLFWVWFLKDISLRIEPDSNIFVVNWMKFSAENEYPLCVVTTELIGKMVSHLIKELKIPPQKIHIYGHSLGAHISGVAGAQFDNPKIARITGLDPAGPFFDHDFRSIRLDYSQADYVDTVNTNSGFLGLGRNIGHVNFFPNGGSDQNGCEVNRWPKNLPDKLKYSRSVICDHSRAFLLVLEGWKNTTIDCEPVAYACDNYEKYQRGLCSDCGEKNENCELLGIDKLPARQISPPDEEISYYIKTSDKSPFCLNHYTVEVMAKNPKRIRGILTIELPDLKENVTIDLGKMRGKEDKVYSILFVHQKPLMQVKQALVSFTGTDEFWIEKINFKSMSSSSAEKREKFSSSLCPKNSENAVTKQSPFIKCS